ncbi:hypothetical protein IW261DRAFT_1423737 [Armillaria novae-zelandiae]|uniref:WD40 repeat-like protein n=1 Tax=Armillaria novae-zelandiae TaxID=153914 RepID=A0AA39NXG4_9AGAR|nr:hypothetical protein IW261DRAFT_1423737 [Armillaria novae-zelandiae]
MSDDVFAAMGISGFGKAAAKRQLDPSRFDKNKRAEVPKSTPAETAQQSVAGPSDIVSAPTKPEQPAEDGDDDENNDEEPGPPLPPSHEPEYDPSEFDDDDDDSEMPLFPVTHEIILKDHTKVVSALALDPSGARILSGSHDYDCKLWDFGGMDMRCKPFKTWEPAGSYHIHDLKYSNDGQKFLVITGTTQARLYDRDGEEEATFVKGDPYIRDMKHTSGHVGELSSCAWHPKDSKLFITGSADSTIRIWDVENKRKQKTVIVVKSKDRGARTKVTACAYSTDGRMIGGACLDGALHMWQTNSNFVRPNLSVEGAHSKGTETGSVVFGVDGRTVLTRGGDDTVKLWDLRSFKKPLATHSGLTTLYPTTNAILSPDGKYVVTGAAASSKGGNGKLMFLDKNTLEAVKTLEVDSTPVKVFWHSKINQIVTGLSSGQICVLYSPLTSTNGAKLLMNKGPPRKVTIEDMSDALAAPSIVTPHALPMFREGDGIVKTLKRKRDRDRMDPRKSRRPELPVTGPGRGGRVGASATQHVVQNLVRDTTRDEDPREALLKYATKATEDPQWTAAWQVNQPKPVFAAVEEEENKEQDNHTMSLAQDPVPDAHDDHDLSATANGVDEKLPAPSPPSSVVTPNANVDADVDVDPQEPEKDARHNSQPLKEDLDEDKMEDVSVVPQSATLLDPASTPIDPHHGTPPPPSAESLPDVLMTEEPRINGINGNSDHINGDDVKMEDVDAPTPNTSHDLPEASSVTNVASNGASPSFATTREHFDEDDDDRPPPAKRARVHSDADKASLAHSATPPPASTTTVASHSSTPVPSTPFPTTSLTLSQYRFCNNSVKSLKKLKDAAPFLRPVDPVALNIPHYPTIIKTPMDFGTIERKVAASNPQKPDPNPSNPRYSNPDEFVADVRLVFENCFKFNGPDHTISAMGRRVEEVFERQSKPPIVKKVATPPPPPPPVPVKKAQPREIHPPPPKDLPYADVPKKHRKTRRVKDDGTAEQLRFCSKILQDLSRKQHWDIASPFYEPVDWVNLDLPTYPKIVKKPMDMATMRKKLDNGDYPSAQKFCDDFKLMIRNCFAFNPQGTPVNMAGIELQRLFDLKWKALPPLHEISEEEDDEEDPSDDEHSQLGAIAALEDQMRTMNDNLTALKNLKANKDKKKPKKEKPPHPSTSKPSKPKPLPPQKNGKKSAKKAGVAENDFLTFDQKKDLSEAIQGLDGAKLERVIKIIHEGVPEIRDSTEEIELEIDLLPPPVLTKLYNFVIRPLRAPPVKRNRHGKGTGTGGLNRKSMDEDVEAEKIRQLEQRMALFEGASGAAAPAPKAMDSESDSSSASDSSGSDSE